MKIVRYILPVILLVSLLTGGFVFALELGDSCRTDSQCSSLGGSAICLGADSTRNIEGACFLSAPQGPESAGAFLQIIDNIGDWVFAIFLAISVIFLVWGAFEFVTSEGNPEKVSSAKKRLLYAVIGISLGLLANGVDDILRSILIK
jgi:hypothetical protein